MKSVSKELTAVFTVIMMIACAGAVVFHAEETEAANGDVTFTLTAPSDATVEFAKYNVPQGKTAKYYWWNFVEIQPVSKTASGDNTVYTYNLTVSTAYQYSVGGPNYVSYKSIFTASSSTTAKTVTKDDLYANSSGITSATVVRGASYGPSEDYPMADVGGLLTSIDSTGVLYLSKGQVYTGFTYRAWSPIDYYMSNMSVEPDMHFVVMDFDGTPSDLVTVEQVRYSGNGVDTNLKITAGQEKGVAVVVAYYDSMTLHDQFFSATWPELCSAFVVAVGQTEGSFKTNITVDDINYLKPTEVKSRALDSEIDYIYYDNSVGYGTYTFTPDSGIEVYVLNPVIGDRCITGFEEGTVTDNGDGSFTVKLTEGRNIIYMTDGTKERYQVITAMPYEMHVASQQTELNGVAAYNVTVSFTSPHKSTVEGVTMGAIFNSKGKLAGIYNSGSQMNYQLPDGSFADTYRGKYGEYDTIIKAESQKITFTVAASEIQNNGQITLTFKGLGLSNGDWDGGTHRNWWTGGSALGYRSISVMPDLTITADMIVKQPNDGGADDLNGSHNNNTAIYFAAFAVILAIIGGAYVMFRKN